MSKQIKNRNFGKEIWEDYFEKPFKYIVTGGVATIITLTLQYIFTEYLNIYYIVSGFIATTIVLIMKYFIFDRWVFK